jgi:4-hydroxybenzoate polyprenyltransferase
MTKRWPAYLELLRLPAVFTAVADVMMGYLVTHGDLRPASTFLLLVAASSCLYLAGMALNDAYDADVDARERPERPIPSGRISRAAAFKIGWILIAAGVVAAGAAGFLEGDRRPFTIAIALATLVFIYDAIGKRTALGPLILGACRMLNVLLGMSLVGRVEEQMTAPWTTAELLVASGLGAYIIGVTMFARTESSTSIRRSLAAATTVSLLGLAIIASAPLWQARLTVQLQGWWLLWIVLALVIARRCVLAIVGPSSRRVQAAVRHSLRSIIVIDAAIVLGFCGVYWGCAVLLLLAPMLLLETAFSTT